MTARQDPTIVSPSVCRRQAGSAVADQDSTARAPDRARASILSRERLAGGGRSAAPARRPPTPPSASPMMAKSWKSVWACSRNRCRSAPATGGSGRCLTAAARSRKRRIIASMSSVSAILAEASAGRRAEGPTRGRPPRPAADRVQRAAGRVRPTRRAPTSTGGTAAETIDSGAAAGSAAETPARRADGSGSGGAASGAPLRSAGTVGVGHRAACVDRPSRPASPPRRRRHRPRATAVSRRRARRPPRAASATATAAAGRTLTPGRATPPPATDGGATPAASTASAAWRPDRVPRRRSPSRAAGTGLVLRQKTIVVIRTMRASAPSARTMLRIRRSATGSPTWSEPPAPSSAMPGTVGLDGWRGRRDGRGRSGAGGRHGRRGLRGAARRGSRRCERDAHRSDERADGEQRRPAPPPTSALSSAS